jgi:hypothetical protein
MWLFVQREPVRDYLIDAPRAATIWFESELKGSLCGGLREKRTPGDWAGFENGTSSVNQNSHDDVTLKAFSERFSRVGGSCGTDKISPDEVGDRDSGIFVEIATGGKVGTPRRGRFRHNVARLSVELAARKSNAAGHKYDK